MVQWNTTDKEKIVFGMMQEYESSREVPALSALVRDLLPRAKELLKASGCFLLPAKGGMTTIVYPDKTVKRELLPRIRDSRYNVYLPNGLKIVQQDAIMQSELDSPRDVIFVMSEEAKIYLRGETDAIPTEYHR